MDFNPDIWGTYADWVGGIGTTAAFIAAAIVIAKDAKVRKIAQARRVVYVVEIKTEYRNTDAHGVSHPEEVTYYTLKNLSDEPIYRVVFYDTYNGGRAAGIDLDTTPVILPGKEYAYEFDVDNPPLVMFRDNSDVRWVRNIKGKVRPFRLAFFLLNAKVYAE